MSSSTAAPAAPTASAAPAFAVESVLDRRQQVRNFAGFTLFEVFWGMGLALTFGATVLPAYFQSLKAPLWLIALMPQLPVLAGLLTEPVVLKYLAWRERRLNAMVALQVTGTTMYLAMGLLAWWGGLEPRYLVWASVALLGVQMLVGNLGAALYYGLMMEVTPQGWRGRLVASRGIALAVTGLVGGLLCRALLAEDGLGGYASCFLLAGCIYLGGSLVMRLGVVEPAVTRHHHPAARSLRGQLTHLWGQPRFRRWLGAHLCLMVAMSSVGLITVVHRGRFDSDKIIGAFTMAIMVGRITTVPVAGYLADRIGYKCFAVLLLSCYAGSCLVTAVTEAAFWWVPAFLLLGVGQAVSEMWMANYPAELLPRENRVGLISVGRLFGSPVAVVAAVLIGRLAAHFPQAVLLIPAVVAGTGAAIVLLTLPEPRREAAAAAA